MRPGYHLSGLLLHDPMIRRGPSLVSADESQWDDARAVDSALVARCPRDWLPVAQEIGADLVTFSTGPLDALSSDSDEENLDRFAGRLSQLMDADRSGRSCTVADH